MKILFLSLLLALLCIPCGAAPSKASTFDAAQPLLKDDGYVLFAFAEDWDSFSKAVCQKLMNSDVVKQAAGDAVFMEVPVPNVLTDARKAADKTRFGKLSVPDAPDYPALLLLTKSGRHYATITGSFMHAAAPKKVAGLLKKYLQAMHRQEELLAKAAKAQGVEKARLLGEASCIPDLNPPDKIGKIIAQIKQLDPKNQTGYARRLIAPIDLAYEISGIEKSKDPGKGWEAALAQAEAYLRETTYSDEQRQALYAVAIGVLRRNMGVRAAPKIREYASAMANLIPDNYLGKSAKIVARDWGLGFNLADGWSPDVLCGTTAKGEPIEVEGPLPFLSPGIYTVTFNFTRGRHAANIIAVSLFDDQELLAEDRHIGRAGKPSKDNVYSLKLNKEPRHPRLLIQFDQSEDSDQSGRADSFGTISVEKS